VSRPYRIAGLLPSAGFQASMNDSITHSLVPYAMARTPSTGSG
jgi:hypothetical protein